MAHERSRRWTLAVLAALPFVAGCPLAPQLGLSTFSIGFGADAVERFVTITNAGGGALNWTATEVVRASASAPWVAGDVPWLSVAPDAGSTRGETDRLALTANRAGLVAAVYNNAGIRIASNGGDQVVPVSMTVEPTLEVAPSLVPLSNTATSGAFTLTNTGAASAAWEVLFLPNPDDPATARPILPADGITVTPNPGSTAPGAPTQVSVAFAAGRGDFDLFVQSSSGGGPVSFRFGATLQGLEVRPGNLTLYIDPTPVAEGEPPRTQVASKLRIINTGAVARPWTLAVRDIANPGTAPSIQLSQSSGTTAAAQQTLVDVSVVDAAKVQIGSGFYEILVQSGEAFQTVAITIEPQILPIVELSEPPQSDVTRPEVLPIDVLDLGRDLVQATFYVVNVGPRGSRLWFQVSHEDQDAEKPLILDVRPLEGDTNGPEGIFFHPEITNLLIDAQPIVVTVDRSALEEDVEFREITVVAVNEDFDRVIDAVEPKTLLVRVERQPLTMEGANNRARPPSMMRFVFQLRDSRGEAIPTLEADSLDRIRFAVEENGIALDPNETTIIVSRPGTGYGDGDIYYKGNVILMLDYTGSMYNAGTDNAENPLDPGEAIEQVKLAALEFIDDLPPGYRIGLMYHSRRQQPNRIIAPFSNDRDALKTALRGFSVPPSESLQSDIRDAIMQAVELLNAENTDDTLPFDDADMNAVVFITDGRDNSSVASVSDLQNESEDNRVRLFPLTYSAGSRQDLADLIVLATETGGHFYAGRDVKNLLTLLDNEAGLAIEPSVLSASNAVFFDIRNASETVLNWTAQTVGVLPWVDEIVPAGGAIPSGQTRTVRVNLDPRQVPPNSGAVGAVLVASNGGDGRADIRFETGADNATAQDVRVSFTDAPGVLWKDFANQIVLTYNTPLQDDGTYNIVCGYTEDDGSPISGEFERDGVFINGIDIAGQLSLRTRGIEENIAATDPADAFTSDVFVYADYVPTRISQFRFRFFLRTPDDLPAAIAPAARAALAQIELSAALAPNGLLEARDGRPAWRLLSEGDGVFVLLTEQTAPLRFSEFGNLLRLRLRNLGDYVAAFAGQPRQPEFLVEMRADNDLYLSPATPTRPSESRYFLYPRGAGYPTEVLDVTLAPDRAEPAADVLTLALLDLDPEAPFAWDRDEDFLADFDDPEPFNPDLPGTIVAPNPVDFAPAVGSLTLTVRNQRLSAFTYTWNDVPGPQMAGRLRINGLAPAAAPPATLNPGQSTTVTLSVDRAGLAEGVFTSTLLLQSDVFGTEEAPVTVAVVD